MSSKTGPDTGWDAPTGHPMVVALSGCRETLAGLAEAPLFSAGDDDVIELLGLAKALEAQVAELNLRLAGHLTTTNITGRDTSVRYTNTANYHAAKTAQNPSRCHSLRAFDGILGRHTPVRTAMTCGLITEAHARVICEAVDELPRDLDPILREKARTDLIGYAQQFSPNDLKVVGLKILETIDPENAEAHEARRLADLEAAAEAQKMFSRRRCGNGSSTIKAEIPDLYADILDRILRAYAAPKHVNAEEPGSYDHETPSSQRLGQAFCDFLSSVDLDAQPDMGGVNIGVTLHVDYDTFLGHHNKAAATDTGQPVSADVARTHGCASRLNSIVFDADGVVMHYGRTRRLFTSGQRKAKAATQTTCQARDCDTPWWLCHSHHRRPWALGGTTNLTDLVFLRLSHESCGRERNRERRSRAPDEGGRWPRRHRLGRRGLQLEHVVDGADQSPFAVHSRERASAELA